MEVFMSKKKAKKKVTKERLAKAKGGYLKTSSGLPTIDS